MSGQSGSPLQNPFTDLGTSGWKEKHTQNIYFSGLVQQLESLSQTVLSKVAAIRSAKSAMSIADMFDLQMSMNKLSQSSEMGSSLVASIHQACSMVSRNLKG